jgi:hypothetical protein
MTKIKIEDYTDDKRKDRGNTQLDKHKDRGITQLDKHKDRGITQMTNIKIEELPR